MHSDKRTSYGRSMIIDPWGKILSSCPSVESTDQRITETGDDFLYVADSGSICFANFDPELLKETRAKMPVRSHRRPDIYY